MTRFSLFKARQKAQIRKTTLTNTFLNETFATKTPSQKVLARIYLKVSIVTLSLSEKIKKDLNQIRKALAKTYKVEFWTVKITRKATLLQAL